MPSNLPLAAKPLIRALAVAVEAPAAANIAVVHQEVAYALEMRRDSTVELVARILGERGDDAMVDLLARTVIARTQGASWSANNQEMVFLPFHLPMAITLLPDDSSELVESPSVAIDEKEFMALAQATLAPPPQVVVLFSPQLVHYACYLDLDLSARYHEIGWSLRNFLAAIEEGRSASEIGFVLKDQKGAKVQLGSRMPGASTLALRLLNGVIVGPKANVTGAARWFDESEESPLGSFQSMVAQSIGRRFSLTAGPDLVLPSRTFSAFGAINQSITDLIAVMEGAMKSAGVPTIGKSPSERN